MKFVERSKKALSLDQFNTPKEPDHVFDFNTASCPHDRQYILRMMIREPHGVLLLPESLEWIRPMVEQADEVQRKAGIRHGFLYATVRHGICTSETDDEWHTDGYSEIISHIPEQNYIVTSNHCTEYISMPIDFPEDFDAIKHDMVGYINIAVEKQKPEVKTAKANAVYVFDPYVIHRKPAAANGKMRTFVRLSYLPIEIYDDKCEPNPLKQNRVYNRIARATRDTLTPYSGQ